MKIPSNTTETELLNLIDRISDRYAYKFCFGFYNIEDIKQEAFIIALEALEKYDETRPLENFLARHIRNRLINFKRDNYFRHNTTSEEGGRVNEIKKMLMDTLDISVVDADHESRMMVEYDLIDNLSIKEITELIDRHLDPKLREDYLKLVDGGKLTQIRRETIIQHLKNIVEDYGSDFSR